MASRNRPRPSSTITKTPKLLQIKTNGGEREDVASEVIELKEQKPIHPPPPSIAVNESRYVCTYGIVAYVCAQCLELKNRAF